jgi:nitrite reductase/ring-hydroxylating ferredoxin subunit/uncharacterized membrane protein
MRWISKLWEEQAWLDGVSDMMRKQARRALKASPDEKKVGDFLHGVWLGHPLHPVLTDVPIGAWTAVTIMDIASPSGRPSRGATGAVAVGVLGAAAAAPAGMMDWYYLSGKTRRAGTAHALLNSAALVCYLASLTCRLTNRGPARRLGYLGFGIAMMSGYLGGHLVFNRQVGVKHGPEEEPPAEYVPVLSASVLEDQQPHRADVAGMPVLLLKQGDRVLAVADTCTHLGCSLASGSVEDGAIVCNCHGSRFSLESGDVLSGPATSPVAAFETRINDGQVEVRVRDDALTRAAQETISRVLSGVRSGDRQ